MSQAALDADAAGSASAPMSPAVAEAPSEATETAAPGVVDPPAEDAAPGASRYDGLRIGRQEAAGGASAETPGEAAGDGGGGIATTTLSLMAVLGLILVGVWLLRKFFPGMRRGGGAGPVQVMGRHFLSPKQQLYVVKIGARVVVIGAAGANLSQVCQITDEEEIADLTSQCEQSNASSISRSFRSLFAGNRGRMAEALAETDAPAEGDGEVAEVREELNSTVGRLRRVLQKRRGES